MKIKTSELNDLALNFTVAKLLNPQSADEDLIYHVQCDKPLNYSTDWAQGGPIIEREEIDVVFRPGDKLPGFWDAYSKYAYDGFSSPTPLVAAMRCYVASELGDEVEVPDELA